MRTDPKSAIKTDGLSVLSVKAACKMLVKSTPKLEIKGYSDKQDVQTPFYRLWDPFETTKIRHFEADFLKWTSYLSFKSWVVHSSSNDVKRAAKTSFNSNKKFSKAKLSRRSSSECVQKLFSIR